MVRSFFLPGLVSLSLATKCIATTDSTRVKILFETPTEAQNVQIQLDNNRGPIETKIRVRDNAVFASAFAEAAYTGLVVRYSLGGKPACTHRFWVGRGQAEIRFFAKSDPFPACPLGNFKLTNAIDVQDRDQKLAEFASREMAVLDSIVNALRAQLEGGDTLAHLLEATSKSIVSAKKKIFNRKLIYFQDHPDEYSFARFSEAIFNYEGILEPSVIQVFESFPQRLRQSPEGQEIIRTIQGNAQHEGSMALDYKTIDINGKPLGLADFKGKYVLMVFWATWCGPCREEIPVIKSLHDTYKDSEKLVVISLAKDDNLSKVKDYIAANNMNWLQVVNDSRLSGEYGVWGVPKTLLIDPNGKIVIIEEGRDISRIVNYLGEKITRRQTR